jgi:hypothetical protein
MKQKQTSLHSLHKMIAATRRYHYEHRIRSARGERHLERRGTASRAQPAIVSRLIAGGRRVHAFIRAAARRDRNGIECGECQETGKEPADMRLPCNRLLDPSHADRAEPEQQVDAEQYQQEGEHARVLQA